MNHKEILIVIDMLKGFIDQGPLADPSIRQIVPENVRLVKNFLEQDKAVLYFQDAHRPDALEFENYPPHCLKGSTESQLIDELKVYEDKMIQVEKNTTNGFFAPQFQIYLKAHPDLEKITVIGCCTDICVLNFCVTMKTYSQTVGKPITIIVPENAVDTFNLPGHDKLTYHKTALGMLKGAGIQVI